MLLLSVNIDHVATLRQARYRGGPDYGEPDLVRAAHEAELGGADGLTVHLREDRRHVTDRDVDLLRPFVRVRFNLEMAATDEMVAIARRVRPHSAMLVPEGREEVTTEGGLDVEGQKARLLTIVHRLADTGALVSAFIDPEVHQVHAAAALGFHTCELHTGPYAHAFARSGGNFGDAALHAEWARLNAAAAAVREAGLNLNAGHALNYTNVAAMASLPGVAELHIGHAIVSRAVYTGLREAVREMKALLLMASFKG